MPRIDAPAGIEGPAARVSESSARAFADSVQSQCLSTVSSAGRMTPVAAAWTSTSSVPSAATSSAMRWEATSREGGLARRRASSAPQPCPQRPCLRACSRWRHGLRRGRETEGDRLPDPARSSGHQDRSALEAHSRGSCGSDAGADEGSSPSRFDSVAPERCRLPATTRARGGRAARPSPRRSVGSSARRVGDELAHARPAGRRSAALQGRRARRCRHESA